MSKDTVRIEGCPHCGGTHIYDLKVERVSIIKAITMYDAYEPSRTADFTRIFVCPVKQEQYQATFYLEDSSSSRIEGVTVVRPSGDGHA